MGLPDGDTELIAEMRAELRRVYDLIWQYQQANAGIRRGFLKTECAAAHKALMESHRIGGWGTDGPPTDGGS
jgi:hypothetical protein